MWDFPLTNTGAELVHPLSTNLGKSSRGVLGLNVDVESGIEFATLLNNSVHINVSFWAKDRCFFNSV